MTDFEKALDANSKICAEKVDSNFRYWHKKWCGCRDSNPSSNLGKVK